LLCNKKVAIKKHNRAYNKDGAEDDDTRNVTLFNNLQKMTYSYGLMKRKKKMYYHNLSSTKCKGDDYG